MKGTTVKTFGALLCAMVFVSPAHAVLFGTVPNGADTDLVIIDTGTGAASVVGATGFVDVGALGARNSDNRLFGGTSRPFDVSAGQVLTILPSVSSAGTAIGTAEGFPIGGMAVSPASGTIYATCTRASLDKPDSLCTVNELSGTLARVNAANCMDANNSCAIKNFAGLAIDGGGTIYASTTRTGNPVSEPRLYTVSATTGIATAVAEICAPGPCGSGGTKLAAGVTGLAFDGATLFGSTDDGRIITIDPANGAYTVVGSIGIAGTVQGLANLGGVITVPTATPVVSPTPGPCSQPSPDNPCIPGGGLGRRDCQFEWVATPVPLLRDGTPKPDVRRRDGIHRPRLICYDGDERCDFDNSKDNNSCTFRVGVCINNSDPRFETCSPLDLASFEVRRPNANRLRDQADAINLAVLENQAGAAGFGVTLVRRGTVIELGTSNNAPNQCSDPLVFVVPLRESLSGAARRSKRLLRVIARNSLGQRDVDRLRLECRPSTCGNGTIETSHETCDDGNRINGDGCNQACQLEVTPTPSNTPTSTATPAPPTDTPTLPAAPDTPTQTATATPLGPTATPGQGGTINITLLSGSGTCAGTCQNGNEVGKLCSGNTECVPCLGICSGGANNGLTCSTNVDCPGGTCPTATKTCRGGPNDGNSCTSAFVCGGICGNKICQSGALQGQTCAGTPDCNGCTKSPAQGSCANIQLPLFPLQLALVGGFDVEVGPLDGEGKRSLRIPEASVHFDPINVGPLGLACVGVAGDSLGFVDCDGGEVNLNILLEQDHNTNPGHPSNNGLKCVGGTNQGAACTSDANCTGGGVCAGLPDDPNCTSRLITPSGAEDVACLEGRRFCLSGTAVNTVCTSDADCGGGTCAPLVCRDGPNARQACTTNANCPESACGAFVCRGGDNPGAPCISDPDCPNGSCMPCSTDSVHAGVCNSPVRATQTGTFQPGDAVITLPQTILLLAGDGSENGPDQLPCTADDTPEGLPAAVNVVLTTGLAQARVYDSGNTNSTQPGGILADGFLCGASPCIGTFQGQKFDCTDLEQGIFGGAIVGGFPAVDTSSGDLLTTFQFVAEIP